MKRLILILTIIILLALPAPLAIGTAPPIQETGSLGMQRFAQAPETKVLYSGSVMFIQNVGQFDERALFQVWGGDKTIWLAKDSIWVTVLEQGSQGAEERGGVEAGRPDTPLHLRASAPLPARGVAIKLSFPGANPQPRIEPFGRLETSVNYFIGNDPEKWHTNVPVWAGVRYKDLYPAIDLELTGEGGRQVPRLVVRPGADLSRVRLRVEGADGVELLPSGEGLRLTTTVSEFTLPLFAVVAPDGTPLALTDVQPILSGDEIRAPFTAALSPPSAFAQDQSNLPYATFLGGNSDDYGHKMAVDGSGSVYVTGYTESSDFPTTLGVYDITHNGYDDAFVVKLNPTGSALTYATFLGGSNSDYGYDIAADESGNAYVTGYTESSNFPTTAGALDRTYNGDSDAFIAKLNPAGSALSYATFLGGSNDDYGYGITVDGSGNAYITGWTWSPNFPATLGAYDRTYNGYGDVFVAKLNPAGNTLAYATFLGGSNGEQEGGSGIAVDSGGAVYITGWTDSSDFPTTFGAYDRTHNGGAWGLDAFVAKMNPSGSSLIYATFLGGSGDDVGSGIVVDKSGNAYIAGGTSSTDFPTTSGAFDRNHGGFADAFVVKMNSTGSALLYSTFLGGHTDTMQWEGSFGESSSDITVDGSGAVYVTGFTMSSDFPVTPEGYDKTYSGGYYDAFIAKLNPLGSNLIYATYLGGSSADYGSGVAVDGSGNIYLTGATRSSNFPTTVGAYDTTHNGGSDTFVVKLAFPPNLSCSTKQASTVQVVPGQTLTYTINLSNCGGGDAPQVRITDTLPISLTYQAGSLWASAGAYGETGEVITWTGALSAGTSAVVRFNAVVSPSLSPTETTAIVNVAQVDDGWHAPLMPAAVVFINPRQVYLPLVMRNR